MKTNTSKKTPIENLKRLVAEFERLDGERLRHEKMATDLADQEAALLPTANIDDPEDFSKLSQLRFRRELAPKKSQEFAAAASDVNEKLIQECQVISKSHSRVIDSVIEKLTVKLMTVLAPFFPADSKISEAERNIRRVQVGGFWDVRDGAESIVGYTKEGSILFNQLAEIRSNQSGFWDLKPVKKAKRLMEFIEAVSAMED